MGVWYAKHMVRIPLPDGQEALIDDADEALVSGFRWRTLTNPRSGHVYVHAWNGYQHFYMHRLISGAPQGRKVDHHNRNGLDNRRKNLRVATSAQNAANRIPDRRKAGTTSDYKGVFWDKSRQRWCATIHADGKTRALGRFKTEREAAEAYDRAALELWGRFARLNLEES